jgi:chaperone BCS1
MTTNHIERLDPALIRPGRVDLQQFVGDATSMQARRLYLQFYDDGSIAEKQLQSLAHELEKHCAAEMAAGRKASMAALQGHFIRSNAKEAVESCRSVFV